VGWIYFGAAWASLLVINGILTFMLTPGRWIERQTFASAYFNPGMLPSLVLRTAVCIALAGVYALITSSGVSDEGLRYEVVRYAAQWLLVGTLVIPLAGLWYISTLPRMAREISMGAAPAVTIFAGLSIFFSALVVAFTYFGPHQRPRHFNLVFALLLAVLALSTTGVTEWVREAVRKPYIIYDYMYANGLRLADIGRVREQGVLKSALWVRQHEVDPHALERAGEEVFRVQCASCHTVNGYNSIRFAVKGWSWVMIDYQLGHLSALKGFMPPFVGTDAERQALGAWLASLNPLPAGIAIEPEPPAANSPSTDGTGEGAPQQ
jgi:mono/diheme cytochrome c family protein